MTTELKKILLLSTLLFGISFGVYKMFFASPCCSADTAQTSGCTPSNCRGATTKFGEAKVISELRLNLIDLKAEMENSESPAFDEKAYDIHGIVGESDEESLEIIVEAVKVVEDAFAQKMNHQVAALQLPANKAKQVEYLNKRIEGLKKLL